MSKPNYNFIDLTGQVFGRWTVLREVPREKAGPVKWICRCECGTEKAVVGHNLRRGLSQSCGCLPKEINSKRTKGIRTGRVPANFIDITGQKFNRWEVLRQVQHDINGHCQWLCRCECGTEKIVDGNNLKKGASKSCGCYSRERTSEVFTTHGMTGTSTYICWFQMMKRCYDPQNKSYKNYGGRGIFVAKEWHNFEGFFADMGTKPSPDLTLERKSVNGPYSRENCIWADRLTQGRNKRNNVRITYGGETFVLTEWAERCGIPYKTLHARIKMGWLFEDAITRPLRIVGSS